MPPPRRKSNTVGRNAPVPLQYSPVTKDDFSTEPGVARFNQQIVQIVDALNKGNGVAGPVVMPKGADVRGSTITGLGTPSDPSDAVSLGHASTNYGAPAVGPQLDIGGKNALRGLTGLQLAFNSLTTSKISGMVTLAKITGGGSNGSLTFVNGVITAYVAPS